jgi:hypothetical protein
VRPNCRVEDRGGTATRWGGRRRIVNGNAQDEKPGRATAPTRPDVGDLCAVHVWRKEHEQCWARVESIRLTFLTFDLSASLGSGGLRAMN